MVMHRTLFREKFQALKKRFNECVSYDMNYDDVFNGLVKKQIEYADIDMICESIGIEIKVGVFYHLVRNKYDDIVTEVTDLLQEDNIPYLIYNEKLERFDRNDYNDKVTIIIKQLYSQPDIHFSGFTHLYEIRDDVPEIDECVEKFWRKLKGESFVGYKNIYLTPYYFLADGYIDNQRIMSDDDFQPNTEYEISLEDMIYRAVLLTEVNYRFVQWLDEMIE